LLVLDNQQLLGDPFVGKFHPDIVKRFAEDPLTEGIIRIRGQSEEDESGLDYKE
jgi:succinyl-CoA synthetase alpha subunit